MHRRFLPPRSMKAAFDEALGVPLGEADYFRCAYRVFCQEDFPLVIK